MAPGMRAAPGMQQANVAPGMRAVAPPQRGAMGLFGGRQGAAVMGGVVVEDQAEKEFLRKAKMGELLLEEQKLQLQQDSQATKDKTQAEIEMVKQLTAGMQKGSADPTSTP